jgi:methionyl-tRNA formyltransferase
MKVVFAGTPEFAAVALRAIHAAGFAVPLVLTQPDRPAGRGMKLQASAVKLAAQGLGLSDAQIVQPHSLRLDGKFPDDAAAARAALEATAPDVLVVAAYGLILPRWVLELPRHGCLNIHGSILPRWRGAAPIHRAIEAGDTETGITIMQMDEGLDTGDMLLTGRVPISQASDGSGTTTAQLHDTLAALGGQLIVEALGLLGNSGSVGLHPTPQPQGETGEHGITYAHKIEKAEAVIDFSQSATTVERRIRAFDPFPGCTYVPEGEAAPVKLWRAAVLPGGRLQVLQWQRPGGKRVAPPQPITLQAAREG